MVKRALLAGNGGLFVFPSLFFLESDGIFGVAVISDSAGFGVARDLLIDDGVDIVGLFGALEPLRLFLLVKINRVFHQLVQQFNLLFINLVLHPLTTITSQNMPFFKASCLPS